MDDELGRADKHIAEIKEKIARQREIVRKQVLSWKPRDASRRLLRNLEDALRAIERRRALIADFDNVQTTLRRRQSKLRRLLARTHSILPPSVMGALTGVVEDAMDAVGANMGNVQIRDAAENLRIVASSQFGPEFLEFFDVVQDGCSTVCGAALREGHRIAVRNVATSPIFQGSHELEVMLRARAIACVSTPLIDSTGQVIGMLNLHWQKPWDLGTAEFHALEPVVSEATKLASLAQDTLIRGRL